MKLGIVNTALTTSGRVTGVHVEFYLDIPRRHRFELAVVSAIGPPDAVPRLHDIANLPRTGKKKEKMYCAPITASCRAQRRAWTTPGPRLWKMRKKARPLAVAPKAAARPRRAALREPARAANGRAI